MIFMTSPTDNPSPSWFTEHYNNIISSITGVMDVTDLLNHLENVFSVLPRLPDGFNM